jgi:membrane protein
MSSATESDCQSVRPITFSRLALNSIRDLHGISLRELAVRTWRGLLKDRIFGHAAELSFYFLFALFPALYTASSFLGLAAQSADKIYTTLLDYFSLIIPTAAVGTILQTFNQTTAASTPGKLTFGLIIAIWSSAVGISAIQDTLNDVFRIEDKRSYLHARFSAILLTILLSAITTIGLASFLAASVLASMVHHHIPEAAVAISIGGVLKFIAGVIAIALSALSVAIIYNYAPDRRDRSRQWLTLGGMVAIIGWVLASLGLRAYLHYFNDYSVVYGSLGAVIILLTWFYTTGLMLLLGAEINSQVENAAAEKLHSLIPEP